jgi:large subunit ribosomal protein L14e
MTYSKFVQVGRIAYVAIGPDQGKICAIVDVIDQNRVCFIS